MSGYYNIKNTPIIILNSTTKLKISCRIIFPKETNKKSVMY